jgi:hypothetical protein
MAGLWADLSDLENPSSPSAQYALESASYLLWVLSGRRWNGVRAYTEDYLCQRACHPTCCTPGLGEFARVSAALAYMIAQSGDPDWGQRAGERIVILRHRPARSLTSVTRISTAEDLTTSLGLYDYGFIAPTGVEECDGFDPCSGLRVAYTAGSLPPAAGVSACLELANELVKAVECPDECRLPDRATSVSRQGINYQIFDPQDFLTEGRVGLYSVDVFIKAVNPHGARLPSRVFSPDLPRARRRTWTPPTP